MQKQVDKEHYNFKKYCKLNRWVSYWNQINEIISLKPQTVLEIGPGDGVVSHYLQNNAGIDYTSVDIAADLHPDIVSSVDDLKIDDNSFDIACCFEVLEHLPFEKFDKSLQELGRVSKKYVIISLPHWGRNYALSIKIPGFKKIKLHKKISPVPKKHKFDGEHYWEIGKKNYSVKLIRKKIKQAGFIIKKDYIDFDSPFHHFFVLEKKI